MPHNPSKCSQSSKMLTIPQSAHNPSKCSQSSKMPTNTIPQKAHNPSKCSQSLTMVTIPQNAHNPPKRNSFPKHTTTIKGNSVQSSPFVFGEDKAFRWRKPYLLCALTATVDGCGNLCLVKYYNITFCCW